jgi:hypothetical protein
LHSHPLCLATFYLSNKAGSGLFQGLTHELGFDKKYKRDLLKKRLIIGVLYGHMKEYPGK